MYGFGDTELVARLMLRVELGMEEVSRANSIAILESGQFLRG